MGPLEKKYTQNSKFKIYIVLLCKVLVQKLVDFFTKFLFILLAEWEQEQGLVICIQGKVF